jgi:hypothetical protein
MIEIASTTLCRSCRPKHSSKMKLLAALLLLTFTATEVSGIHLGLGSRISALFHSKAEEAKAILNGRGAAADGASEYPYFSVIPPFTASLIPGAAETTWSSSCFSSVTGSLDNAGSLNIVPQSPKDCFDGRDGGELYLLASVTEIKLVELSETVTEVWTLPSNASDAEAWDLAHKGVRVFLFPASVPTLLANLVETVELFMPIIVGPGVGHHAAAKNVDFLDKYAHLKMGPISPSNLHQAPPAEEVQSGDFFGVIRLDGLDPMLAWAMGSTTGHTTVALRREENGGQLEICESTAVRI